MFDLRKLIILFVVGILSWGGVAHAASGSDGKGASSSDKQSSSDNKKSSNDEDHKSSSGGSNRNRVSNDDKQGPSDGKNFQLSKDDGPTLAGGENKDSWDGKAFGGNDFDPGLGHAGEHWNDYSTSPIPEPETYAMLLAGLSLLGFLTRGKKNKEL